jgi:hypothetical protein
MAKCCMAGTLEVWIDSLLVEKKVTMAVDGRSERRD